MKVNGVAVEDKQVRRQFVDDLARARDERYAYVLVATGRRPKSVLRKLLRDLKAG